MGKKIEAILIDGQQYDVTEVDRPSCEKCDLNAFCPFPLHCESMIGDKVFINHGKKAKKQS